MANFGIHPFAQGQVSFHECDRPDISKVLATNHEYRGVLVQEGLLIEGLKQSRMVTQDQVLLPGESVRISVACVERGRWGLEGIGSQFGRAPLSVIAAARNGSVGPKEGSQERIQELVWSSVSRHHSNLNNSTTTSLMEVVASYKTEKQTLKSNYKASKGQTGMVVSVLGKPLAMEVFTSPEFFKLQFKEIIQSLLWEVQGTTNNRDSKTEVVEFLRDIADLSMNGSTASTKVSFNPTSLNSSLDGSLYKNIHELAINQQHPILV